MVFNEPVNAVNAVNAGECVSGNSHTLLGIFHFLVRMRLKSLKSESIRNILCGLKVLTLPPKLISVSGTYNIQHKAHLVEK